MAKFIPQDRDLKQLFEQNGSWILAPNDSPDDSVWASRRQNHGSFDDDIEFQRSGASMRDRREQLSGIPAS